MFNKLKKYLKNKFQDKHFLTIFGVSATMMILILLWVLNINNILAGAETRKEAPENKNSFNLEELKKEFSKSVDGLGDKLEEVERWSRAQESQAAVDNNILDRNLDNLIGSIEAHQATGTSVIATTTIETSFK